MLGTGKLAFYARRGNLKKISLTYGISFIERIADGATHHFTVIKRHSAGFVNEYAQIPGSALLDKSYVPQNQT